jgi:hypothetical protein
LIVQVKDNQPTLHQKVADISATAVPIDAVDSHDEGRNRDESRTVTVFDPGDTLIGTDWHSHVAAIIRVERWLGKFGQGDKWKICLRAARMPRIRREHGEASTSDAQSSFQGEGGIGRHQGREDAG